MNILGLQGSPRKKGNTHELMSLFMEKAASHGADTRVITPHSMNIQPCKELILCEKKGICPIKDDMDTQVYSLLKNADLIVLASPVFFYNVPAQLKALIDRCQMFWGRKYKLNLMDPNRHVRQGFMLACGASGGKKLFEGLELTAKIFFDALSIPYKGSLTYRYVENPGDIKVHPTARQDITQAVDTLCSEYFLKPGILFISAKDACRSQMAKAFLNTHAEGRFRALSAGIHPAATICEDTSAIMAEKDLDLKYTHPEPLDRIDMERFERVILVGDDVNIGGDVLSGRTEIWKIPEPKDRSPATLAKLRHEIEGRVLELIDII